MKEKRIFLHVGFHKTATTSFQSTCLRNHETLKAQGFNYPLFEAPEAGQNCIENHSIPIFSAFTSSPSKYHINVMWGITRQDELNQSYLKTLDKALSGTHDVILSGEDISRLQESELRSLIDYIQPYSDNVIILACVRSPYSFHCSNIQTCIRFGLHMDLSKLLSQRERILNLTSAFGQQIHFFPFETACSHESGPVDFLMKRIGIDTSAIIIDRRHPSSSNLATRIQNHFNLREPSIKASTRNLNHSTFSDPGGSKFLLTRDELSSISDDLDRENSFMMDVLGASFCDTSFPVSEDLSVEMLFDYICDYYLKNIEIAPTNPPSSAMASETTAVMVRKLAKRLISKLSKPIELFR